LEKFTTETKDIKQEQYCNIVNKHITTWRTVSSGMLRRVVLVRTDVSEEPGASFIGWQESVS
jgi:hypothetical protein